MYRGRVAVNDPRLVCARILTAIGLAFGNSPVTLAAAGGAGVSSSQTVVNPSSEELIVRVVVNTVAKGDFMLLRTGGRLLVPLREIIKWGLDVPANATISVGSEAYVDPEKLPDVSAKFDAATVTLAINVVPSALKPTIVNLSTGRNPNVVFPSDTSAFFTYGVSSTGTASFGSPLTQLATEMGGRVGDWSLYNAMQWQIGGGEHQFTRVATDLTYDRRETLQRLILGDFTATSGALGSTENLGGVSFSKIFRMDPYFIQYPLPSVRGQVLGPSEIQIRVGDAIVDQRRIPPGPFQVNDILGNFGDRNVTMVVRDAFGRESVYRQPYYYTDLALREGLHEYSYNAGFLRDQSAVANPGYGDFALSAYHRYGLTDAVSIGLRGEGRSGLYNAGAFATALSPRFGIAGIGVAGSNFDGKSGGAVDGFYAYNTDPLQINIAGQYFTTSYATLSTNFQAMPKYNIASSVGSGASSLGAFSIGYLAQVRYDDASQRSATAGYSRSFLDGRAMLIMTYQRGLEGLPRNNFFMTFNFILDRDYSIVAGATSSDGRRTQLLDLTKSQPVGEGLGFRLGAVRQQGDRGEGTAAAGSFQYNGALATVGADYVGPIGNNGDRGSARAFVAGSVGYVNNTLVVARPFQDSFAVVKIGDVPGVPVYLNGQWMGDSNRNGEVPIPSLLSFYDGYITFDYARVPLDYLYSSAQKVISPPLRSGSYVEFALRKVRAVAGTLTIQSLGQSEPAEFREFALTRDSETIAGFTSRRGAFYVEGLSEGTYQLRLTDRSSDCVAAVIVPKQDEPVIELGVVQCATPAR